MDFDTYVETSPRGNPIHDELKDFFNYALKRYKKHREVNRTGFCGEEEFEETVEDYLTESSECLLLFREYIDSKMKEVFAEFSNRFDKIVENHNQCIKSIMSDALISKR